MYESVSAAAVMAVWEEVLGCNIDAESNFFHAGGDSLAALELTARVSDLVGTELSLTDVFDCPDFEKYVAQVQRRAGSNSCE